MCYVLFGDDLFLIEIQVKEYLSVGDFREIEFIGIEVHEDGFIVVAVWNG